MSTEAIDYLSPYLSLPNILTFLNYDEVVRCMQVNKTINNTIDSNWRTMKRKNIYLNVGSHEFKKEYIVMIIFGENDRINAHHEVTIHNRHWEFSCYPRIPLLLEELVKENSVPGNKHNKQNSRFGTHFEMKPEIDGLVILLTALLPRVNITKMNIHHHHRSEDTTLNVVLAQLLDRYSVKHEDVVLTAVDSDYLQVFGIAKAIGASKLDLNYSAAAKEWTAGKTNVKRLGLRVFVRWDELCDDLGVRSKIRTTPEGRSHVFFQLQRSLD